MKIKLPPRDDLDVWGVREDGTRKTLVLKQVIDLYPRMLSLLKAVELRDSHTCCFPVLRIPELTCIKCEIQALMKEVEK
jgi:hypothetical protein